jgi:CBS domain-containing protein
MKCEEIMNTNLEILTEQATVQTAAEVMADTGVGILPICDTNRHVIGVITDRDLTTRVLAKKVDAVTTSATLVMSSPAVTCLATADIAEAEDLMARERKARLMMVDVDGKFVGILTLAALIEHAPSRKALQTAREVFSPEAVGPRGGAAPGAPLLKDDPEALATAPVGDPEPTDRNSVAMGGHWHLRDTTEFPG